MADLDFVGLARALLARSREFLPVWLPGGRPQGREYLCGGLRGGPGSSMSVNMDTGAWADFADADVKGGDLISLFAAVEGIGQGEAAKRLADRIGFRLQPDRREPTPRRAPPAPPAPRAALPAPAAAPHSPMTSDAPDQAKVTGLILPPTGAEPPSFIHPIHGAASAKWTYRDAAGMPMFHVARYEGEDGGKVFAPWSWSAASKGWVMKGWDAPRPLYGLSHLAESPNLPVLIVEGEKATEAARQLVQGAYVVVTWPNGSQAANNASWDVLKGRKVLLWPDADLKLDKEGQLKPYDQQPGPRAMAQVAAILSRICESVKIIDVGLDTSRADGWDAADALAEGWTWAQLIAWAKPRARLWEPRKEEQPALNLTVQGDAAIQVNVAAPEEDKPKPPSASLHATWEELGIAITEKGSPIFNTDNALRVMERHPSFKDLVWFDAFHQKYLTLWNSPTPREWRDIDDLNLTQFMQRDLGLTKMSDEMVNKAARIHAHQHLRNEPRDWLEGRTWDGVDRLETFFIQGFGAADNEYTRAAAKNFWIGMVARIFRPGCQVDNMVVLEGAQGAGKTRALRLLGGPWYSEAHESVTDKDFFMILHGKLIVEIAELDAFNRAEVTRIKQVVSCTTDRYRAPYGRAAQDHPRMSVFVGTTNEKAYLRDNTGGRRFWPISCGAIDLGFLGEFREQFFAEAVALFKKGVTWWEMPVAATAAVQESRRQDDEWEGVIHTFLDGRVQTTVFEVARDALKIDVSRLDRFIQNRVGTILRHLGWDKGNRVIAGVQQKVWRRKGVADDVEDPAPEESIF